MKSILLYVDDEPINLKLFELNFNKKYEVMLANDGFAGLDMLEKRRDIQIVITDMKMPEMNGVEFIRKAKSKFPEKKFFILTGYEITREIQQALDEGLILKYFSKPFNFQEIDGALEAIIN